MGSLLALMHLRLHLRWLWVLCGLPRSSSRVGVRSLRRVWLAIDERMLPWRIKDLTLTLS